MNVVVDTSIWVEFFRGKDFPVLEEALKEGRAFITPVIAAELMSGVHSAKEDEHLEEFLRELPSVTNEFSHWISVGRLRVKCQKKGFILSTPDAHIAQSCLDLEASLYTYDAIFKKVSSIIGLDLV